VSPPLCNHPADLTIIATSIINERKNHANFQLIIITHDENFLRKLGQGDVMDYYWYAYPKFPRL
jgi:wobble nucleotide-excising tRNase